MVFVAPNFLASFLLCSKHYGFFLQVSFMKPFKIYENFRKMTKKNATNIYEVNIAASIIVDCKQDAGGKIVILIQRRCQGSRG